MPTACQYPIYFKGICREKDARIVIHRMRAPFESPVWTCADHCQVFTDAKTKSYQRKKRS